MIASHDFSVYILSDLGRMEFISVKLSLYRLN